MLPSETAAPDVATPARASGGPWPERALTAALAAVVFVAGLTAIADGDIFWHLAAGREMLATGAFLRRDPFSVSALGRPWIDVHWLFQLGVHAVERAAGLRGLVLVKAGLTAAGAVALLRLVRREAGPAAAPAQGLFAVAFSAALLAARHLLLVRPVVLTLLFLALFVAVLERHRRDGQSRVLWWLPAGQVLWVNCQGLAALGPALVGAYLVAAAAGARWGDRRFYPFCAERPGACRPLGLALLGCAAASFVSPYGPAAALLPFRLLLRITPAGANVFASQVAENIPPFVLARTAPEQVGHLPIYLGALALSFVAARGRLPASRLIVLVALVVLALMANRNVLLLYWLGTPLAVLNLAPALLAARLRLPIRLRMISARVFTAVAGAGLLAVGGLALAAAAGEPALAAPTPFRFPTESARVLKAGTPPPAPAGNGIVGTIFAPDHQGGYLIWTLHPRFRPYLDTRLILRTAEEFGDYLDLLDHPTRWDDFNRRHHFDYVVLPTAYPDRYLGLIQHLAGNPAWTLIFTDGSEVVFAPAPASGAGLAPVDLAAPATTAALLAALEARYPAPDLRAAARRHLARLDLLLGHLEQARAILALAPEDDPASRGLLGRAHLLAGDLEAAQAIGAALVAADPDDVASLDLLALVALRRGDRGAALGWLRRALRADPYDPEARALLEHLER